MGGKGAYTNDMGEIVQVHDSRAEIVEQIVEREAVREVYTGISEEEMVKVKQHAAEEKQVLMKQAREDMKSLIDQQSRTAQERAELQAKLDQEAEDRRMIEEQKKGLIQKLKMMEEKLIIGGEMMTKATQQELQLRKAENELRQRNQQEAQLARELAEKEEENLQLEEHFSSLQEEVEVKTKKLKTLFTKHQTALSEIENLQEEFQTERTDLLDTIRLLTQNLKLKDLVMGNFIPNECCEKIDRRATWSDDDDAWVIQRVEMSGSQIRNRGNKSCSLDKGNRNKGVFTPGQIELHSEGCVSDDDGSSELDKVLALGIDEDDDNVGYEDKTSTPYPYL